MRDIRHRHRQVYEANAAAWDARRSRALFERGWLDRFLAPLRPGAPVLDLGCGGGEPIARYLIERGFAVTGLDFAPAMLGIARARFPDHRWIEADMRDLDLEERFAGILGWDSFFHLTPDEQRALIPRLARHLEPGGTLLLTVGPEASEPIGQVEGEPVYHASLSPSEYRDRLAAAGLTVAAFAPEDAQAHGHSVLLALQNTGSPPVLPDMGQDLFGRAGSLIVPPIRATAPSVPARAELRTRALVLNSGSSRGDPKKRRAALNPRQGCRNRAPAYARPRRRTTSGGR